jgi:hypothetical protein
MSSSPQDKSWSPRTQKLVLWGFGLVVVLALVYWNYTTFVGGIWSADTNSPDCIKTKGIVTDIHASGGSARKSVETYYLSYEYKVGGETYDNKEQVTFNLYNRVRLHDEVDICYMKDHPSRAAAFGNDVRGENYFIVFITDLAFLIVVFLIIRSMIRQRKKAAAAAAARTVQP